MLRQALLVVLISARVMRPDRVDGDAVGGREVPLLDDGVEERGRGLDAVGRGDPPGDLGLARTSVRGVGVAREARAEELGVGGTADGPVGGEARDVGRGDAARPCAHPGDAVARVRDDAGGDVRGMRRERRRACGGVLGVHPPRLRRRPDIRRLRRTRGTGSVARRRRSRHPCGERGCVRRWRWHPRDHEHHHVRRVPRVPGCRGLASPRDRRLRPVPHRQLRGRGAAVRGDRRPRRGGRPPSRRRRALRHRAGAAAHPFGGRADGEGCRARRADLPGGPRARHPRRDRADAGPHARRGDARSPRRGRVLEGCDGLPRGARRRAVRRRRPGARSSGSSPSTSRCAAGPTSTSTLRAT